jgi:hypothetical protein
LTRLRWKPQGAMRPLEACELASHRIERHRIAVIRIRKKRHAISFSLCQPHSPRLLAAWRRSCGGTVDLFWCSNAVALLSERRYMTRSTRSYINAPGRDAELRENNLLTSESTEVSSPNMLAFLELDSSEESDYDHGESSPSARGTCFARVFDLSQGEAPRRFVTDVLNWEKKYNDPEVSPRLATKPEKLSCASFIRFVLIIALPILAVILPEQIRPNYSLRGNIFSCKERVIQMTPTVSQSHCFTLLVTPTTTQKPFRCKANDFTER